MCYRCHRVAVLSFARTETDWKQINQVSGQIVDSAICVHSALGPGLLESAYRACLAYELRKRDLAVLEEVAVPVVYDGRRLDIGYRIDVLVESVVVVEIKAVERIAPVHKAQLLSYMRLSGKPLGLLLNFNVFRMKEGIARMRIG
jgi:GxxExxY protein